MPKFFNSRDLDFIQTISEEVVNHVVEQMITLFKMSVGESKTNLYGESLGKIYHAPANLMCIVDREPLNQVYEGLGPDSTQAVEFRFMRHKLRSWDIPKVRTINGQLVKNVDTIQNSQFGYPEIGDIIFFDGGYYEIDQMRDSKLVGGSPSIYNQQEGRMDDAKMELTAIGFMVRRSQIQIEDPNTRNVTNVPTTFDSEITTFDNTTITF